MLNIIGENNNLGQFVGLNNRMNDRMKKYSPEFASFIPLCNNVLSVSVYQFAGFTFSG
jgi:hypothetical protein